MQNDILQGNSGEVLRNMQGSKYFVFYSPVETTQWTVAIVCAMSELHKDAKLLRNMLIVLGIIALLLMIALSYKGIRKVVAPIEDFSDVAKKIATGKFDVELPNITSQDELKELHDSFEYLQQSLVKYIEELKDTTANQERIESELRIASSIQMGMLPKQFPAFPERNDISLWAKLVPAKEVGGDLYDFFIEDEKLYFIIGDVSGKGVPAALFMAIAKTVIKNLITSGYSVAECFSRANTIFSENNEAGLFITSWLGMLNVETGVLTFVNAGHNPPLLYKNNSHFVSINEEEEEWYCDHCYNNYMNNDRRDY
jgi:sigma-B regulation protein RsbU (phosphoserine phosphatase)